jgi:peptide/nickel transport system ATP-binding protein
VSIQATILNLLTALQRDLELPFQFISHDLSVVSAVADAIAVMRLGELVEQAPSEQVFSAPQHPYTRALIDSVPRFAHVG